VTQFRVWYVQKSLVTAMTTRRKQQQQMVQRAMLAEEDRRRAARKNFRMLTVPVCTQASCEPALLHSAADDHDDGIVNWSLNPCSPCAGVTTL